MIRSLSIFALFCCILGNFSRVNAQAGDSTITYSVIKLEPCRYRLFVNNTSPNCFNAATLLLQAGYYTGFTANGAEGWVVEQLSPTELLLTHSNGLYPVGSTRTVDFTFFEPGGAGPIFSVLYPNLCLMEGYFVDFPLEACPGACVSGTVYRECQPLPYANQIPLQDWTVQIVDAQNSVVGSAVSAADGSYSICDLAPGQYTAKAAALPGWIAKLPPSGQWMVNVAAAGNYTRDFGYCPPCSCDSLDVLIAQEPGLSDTNTYYVLLNYDPYCFLEYTLTIENGDLVDFALLDSIFVLEKTGPNTLLLRAPKPPPYSKSVIKLEPCRYRLASPGSQSTSVSVTYDIGAGPVTCIRKFEYPPQAPGPCCPSGTAPGPELVKNGDFEAGNTNFTSGHAYVTPPGSMAPGQYTVAQSNQISTINNRWDCTDHTNGSSTGKMLVVDGSRNPPGIVNAWKQNVPVTGGKTYAFSAWMNNLVVPSNHYNDPLVELYINGKPVTGIALSEAPDKWWQICAQWKAPATGTAVLEVRIGRFKNPGNDFAVDDISFRACEPAPCQADFAVNFIDQCGHVQLVSQPSGGVPPYTTLWSNSSNANTLDLQLPCGNYSYCLTITDAANCTSTICKSFTVSDITPPKAVCVPSIGIDLDANCEAKIAPGFFDGGSTDNCQIKTVEVSPDVVTGCGVHTVTLTVTDWCGNTSTCTAGVQTLEVTPPIINCPQNLTVHGVTDPLGICRTEVTGIAPVSVSDNCDLLGVGYTINAGSLVALPDASGTIFSQGTTTVAYSAADQCLNTASCSFTVTVVCPDCVCPTPDAPGIELAPNGDFDNSGGFTSGYSNNCSGQMEGQYCVTNDASKVNPGFDACRDPTGAGNIFVVNGALTPNTDVLCYSFNSLTPNTDYIFSFYHASVSGASPAQLAVYFDGTQAGSVAQLALATCAWRKYCVVWNSGNNTSVTVCIRNLNTQAQGNDFAIDKVSFKECSKCAPLPPGLGLVLWMPMDEIGGEPGISSIVGGLFAISSPGVIGAGGPNPVPGKVDVTGTSLGALQFISPGFSTAAVSNDPKLNFGAGPFTIDAWINTSVGTQTEPIVIKMDNQGGYAFSITGTPSAAAPTLVINTTAPGGVEVLKGPPIAVGQWNFVAVVVDPPDVRFYVGGDPGGASTFTSSTQTLVGIPNASSNSPMRIGYNPQNPHWNITIDELEIFNTALTAQQLNQIWDADAKGKCRSLCQCGGFSKLFVRNTKGSLNQSVSCSGATVNLPCEPGLGYHLTGVFHCDGGECAPEHTIHWNLTGPGGTQSGTFTDNDPFFGIHLLPNWFGKSGTYTLKMSGDCGAQTCSCEVKFQVDCPNLCPCDNNSVQTFYKNVSKGFAAAVSLNSCTACFSPLALSDCETVDWYLYNLGGPYLGTTYGKQTLCHTFASPGNYTVVMYATRNQPDGSICVDDSYTRTVSLSCSGIPDCPDSVLPNPKFSQNSGAGNLDSIPGWKGMHWGDPHENLSPRVVETGNSQDGWVVAITGDYLGGSVLGTASPLCVSKSDSGVLVVTMRTPGEPIPGAAVNVGRRPPGGNNTIMLYTGSVTPAPDCPDANCYPLAVLEGLLPFDEDAWYELQIPYKLSDWAALDSCGDQAGGIPARMAFYVSNLLSEEQQSAGPVNDAILIDHVCFRGMTVSASEAVKALPLRIFPNPNTGTFTVELLNAADEGTQLRVIDLAGRLLSAQSVQTGSARQTVEAGAVPAGLYFLQVVSEGKILAIEKFIKQ